MDGRHSDTLPEFGCVLVKTNRIYDRRKMTDVKCGTKILVLRWHDNEYAAAFHTHPKIIALSHLTSGSRNLLSIS